MVVIRRELPRTNSAGPAATACRIAYREDSPLPCASPAADHLRLNRVHRLIRVTSCRVLKCTTWDLRLRALCGNADGPDEAQQLSPHGGDSLLLHFAFCE